MPSGLQLRCSVPTSRWINGRKRYIAVGCNAWLMQNHSVITWCLCPPSSVDEKMCVRSGHCQAMHDKIRATTRWAPTDRQLADAVGMLRSCLRKCEYQLSPAQTTLQRTAEDRERRTNRDVRQHLPTRRLCLRHHHVIQRSSRHRVSTCVWHLLLFRRKPDRCSLPRLAATCKCAAFWRVWDKSTPAPNPVRR